MTVMAFNEALREALHEEMARDESVFVMGEDVITPVSYKNLTLPTNRQV